MTTYVKDAAVADYQDAKLKDFTGDPLRSELVNYLYHLNTGGMVYTGKPTWHATVTSVSLDTNPRKATLTDCADSADWKVVYKKSGKSASAPHQATRYPVHATAEWHSDRWLILTAQADRGKKC